MVLDTKQHPEALKDEVQSPGGTSAHAVSKFNQVPYQLGKSTKLATGIGFSLPNTSSRFI